MATAGAAAAGFSGLSPFAAKLNGTEKAATDLGSKIEAVTAAQQRSDGLLADDKKKALEWQAGVDKKLGTLTKWTEEQDKRGRRRRAAQ